MKKKQILVLGGTGKTGRKIVERLRSLGEEVRVGSRSGAPAFDWNKPETWAKTLVGIDTVYISYQPDLAVPVALQSIKDFVELAVESNVSKMVILSGRGEQEAELCEQVVMNAGVPWAVVRCDWFNQNFSESFFLEPILAGHLALPRAEVLIPFVDTDDIADVAVEALLYDKHNGEVLELTGPRLLTFKQVVEEINQATGRAIQFYPISLEKYVEMLQEHQVPADFVWLVNYLFTHVLDGRNANTTNTIERVLGRKAKDFSEYAKELAATGVWNPTEVVSE